MTNLLAIAITETRFSFARKTAQITGEAALDGLYCLRTSLPEETLDDHGVVRATKPLAKVERAFRSSKTIDLRIRPIHHLLEDRVRAHLLLCMLATHVEWDISARIAPML